MMTDNVGKDTFQVVANRVKELLHKVEKINRRARKLGCELVEVEVGEPYDCEIKENGSVKILRKCEVKIIGEPPKVEGWTFTAKLMHIDSHVIISTVPGLTVPEEFREVSPGRCDHCNTNRYRLDTFVIRNGSGWKVVGRNCLSDFLGGHDPKKAAASCEYMLDIRAAGEEAESYGGGSYRFLNSDILSRTAVAIRENGWTSRAKARDTNKMATADSVLFDFIDKDLRVNGQLKKEITSADRDEAKAALEWVREVDPINDYLYNVKTIAKMDSVEPKLFGFTCSILAAYRKHIGQEIERKKAKEESKHFGTIGKREIFELTVIEYTTFEGHYGRIHIYKMIEGAGNIATWFASREQDLEVGEVYKMKATIKNHEEYKGVAQTMLIRCAKLK